MAFAMAKGLCDTYKIEVVGRNPHNLEQFEARLGCSISKAALEGFDISNKTVLLCVKPGNVVEVSQLLQGTADVIYSVLAGTSIETLTQHLNAKAIVRAMPNVAATVGYSMTTLTGDVSRQNEALTLFNAIGASCWLGTEKELNVATALAGSGPAYLALVAEALADGAVAQGLKREDAMNLMRGLFNGFGALIQEEHPALLKEQVMSPGGTTAAGCAALEKAGVRDGCFEAIAKAYERSTKL